MSDDRFVTEDELKKQRQKRQEEWERVRKPEEPKEAPEPEYDPRSLYDRLKEQRDKKQLDQAEARKLKNMVRGLDTEETEFLDMVDSMKSAEDRKRKNEERQLLAEVKTAVAESSLRRAEQLSPTAIAPPPPKVARAQQSSQAKLLAGAIKRKSSSSESVSTSKKTPTPPPSPPRQVARLGARQQGAGATVVAALRPTAMRCVGVRAGMPADDVDSSDSSADSDSSASDADSRPVADAPAEQSAAVARRSTSATSEKARND